MRRAAEDRAGAIVHQHIVHDPDGQMPVRIERMLDRQAGVEAHLLGGVELFGGGALPAAFLDERCEFGRILRQFLGQRMVGRNRREARAEQRVGTRRKDVEPGRAADHLEAEFQALRLADPVFLHQPHLVGPFVEALQPFEQLVGEVGDLEEPLRQFLLLDERARAPAATVDHLLVREHGHVDGVPVDVAFLARDEAVRKQVEEQRLFLPVIVGFAGRELAAPVDRETEALELRTHRRDIVARPAAGVDALFHRGILGRHAERVPAHRVEHIVPGHPLEAREHVAHRIVADMPHMDAPRRIGEHLEDIGLGLVGAVGRGKAVRRLPRLLPAGVGGESAEARFAGHSSVTPLVCSGTRGARRRISP